MKIEFFDTPELLAQTVASSIIDFVIAKPNAVLCMASGDTPRLTNKYIVEAAKKNRIDFSRVQFVSLDEWVGIPPSNTGSCYYFLNETIFEPLNIPTTNIHFFNSTAGNLSVECERINQIVEDLNGIDIILVGIGMNGHIGFNEPGVSPDLFAHVINLDPITLQTGQKYFSETAAIQKGITLGISRIMQSPLAILLATGSKKAAIIKKTLEENISNAVPASFIRKHANAFVMLDREAASLLNK
ncbi:MAG: glucosamine-6-phosphate deaminase [Bacteroidota bacterium]